MVMNSFQEEAKLGARRASFRGKKGMFLNAIKRLLKPWRASVVLDRQEKDLQTQACWQLKQNL